ncbi:MAG: hypothetical protein EOO46_04785 [Flavobacterium sp.]|nr:MAG: hypothetical protein EOO46_04785 [Flavobacterium sp.]
MNKKKPIRNYKMQDVELYGLCRVSALTIEGDLEHFAPYGVTRTELEKFRADNEVFGNEASDRMLVLQKSVLTEEKDAVAEDLRVAIREMMQRVENKFGVHTAIYRKFGTELLSRKTDYELLTTARRVFRAGTKLLPELASKGVTVAMLENLMELRNKMEDLKIDIEDAITDRDVLQEERVRKGNALYAELVDLCATGCTIWETKSEARYNDYIIYKTKKSKEVEENDSDVVE